MSLIVRINRGRTFEIAEWNAAIFSNETKLDLLTNDFTSVADSFHDIELLEIINDEVLLSQYTSFNSYDAITFLGDRYVDRLKDFVPVMTISLTKTNLVEQVDRLDKKVNNVIDVDSMSLEEYRSYILEQISKACETDIYEGLVIELSNGNSERFSFNAQDQQDLKALFDTALQFPNFNFSWHSNKNLCRLYPAVDIIKIYASLQIKLLRATTYCNALNQLVINSQTRDEVAQYFYGYELPEENKRKVDEIIVAMSEVFNAILAPFIPNVDDENNEDVNNESNNSTDDNENNTEDDSNNNTNDEENTESNNDDNINDSNVTNNVDENNDLTDEENDIENDTENDTEDETTNNTNNETDDDDSNNE